MSYDPSRLPLRPCQAIPTEEVSIPGLSNKVAKRVSQAIFWGTVMEMPMPNDSYGFNPLWNIFCQIGWFPKIGIKATIWNHHLDNFRKQWFHAKWMNSLKIGYQMSFFFWAWPHSRYPTAISPCETNMSNGFSPLVYNHLAIAIDGIYPPCSNCWIGNTSWRIVHFPATYVRWSRSVIYCFCSPMDELPHDYRLLLILRSVIQHQK